MELGLVHMFYSYRLANCFFFVVTLRSKCHFIQVLSLKLRNSASNYCTYLFISISFYILVVTGASDGIGKEFALKLAASKYNVFLLARTQSKLDELAREISTSIYKPLCILVWVNK
jgi:rRNA maturation protein Rpf1